MNKQVLKIIKDYLEEHGLKPEKDNHGDIINDCKICQAKERVIEGLMNIITKMGKEIDKLRDVVDNHIKGR